MSQLVPLSFNKIMQTKTYTVIILEGEGKNFAIYTEPLVGKLLQMYLTEAQSLRPMTHDLLLSVFQGLDISVMQVVIHDIQDTVYFAKLFLEQEKDGMKHVVEIDARPSDAITLALLEDAPVLCTKEVLNRVIPLEA